MSYRRGCGDPEFGSENPAIGCRWGFVEQLRLRSFRVGFREFLCWFWGCAVFFRGHSHRRTCWWSFRSFFSLFGGRSRRGFLQLYQTRMALIFSSSGGVWGFGPVFHTWRCSWRRFGVVWVAILVDSYFFPTTSATSNCRFIWQFSRGWLNVFNTPFLLLALLMFLYEKKRNLNNIFKTQNRQCVVRDV